MTIIAILPSCSLFHSYLRGSPACRRQWQPPRPAYKAVASFLQSLVVPTEPRFAMFGPGLEQLDISLLEKLMFSPDVLPVAGIPQRQIGGMGCSLVAVLLQCCCKNFLQWSLEQCATPAQNVHCFIRNMFLAFLFFVVCCNLHNTRHVVLPFGNCI